MAARPLDCYEGPQVYVLDVSHHQGHIDWHKVAAHRWNEGTRECKVTGVFIRALEGVTIDETFDHNWRGAKAAGLLVGPYVYFRARHSGGDQMRMLSVVLGRVGGIGHYDMSPMCDMETLDEQTKAMFLERVREWTEKCREDLRKIPWFYSGAFWNGYVGTADFKNYPLMTPDYRSRRCAGVPRGWGHWTFHQFTSQAQISGIHGNVDMSRFRGDDTNLAQLIAWSNKVPSGGGIGIPGALAILGIGIGAAVLIGSK